VHLLAKVLSDSDTNPVEWMEADYFLKSVKHFVSHVKLSKEWPTFLPLGEYISHLSNAARDYCKEKGMTDLSFPTPLPSLAVASWGGCLQAYVSRAYYSWIKNSPGQNWPSVIYQGKQYFSQPWRYFYQHENRISTHWKFSLQQRRLRWWEIILLKRDTQKAPQNNARSSILNDKISHN
jgi:hypothetical protein